MTKAVFYQSIGPELARYDIDVDGATLTRRDAVTTPGANVQYVWPHPSKKFLYVVSSDGGPGTIPGTKHVATAFRIDPASGALTPHGDAAPLPSRPVHCSVDRSRRISADRLQLSEQHHGPSHQAGRHARRAGSAARKARRRHFRASGPDHAGQPDRDHGHARQQSRRRTSPRTPARSRSMASRTACCRNLASIAPRQRAGLRPAPFRLSSRPSRGCSSRSSGRASCTSTGSTTTARCRATRCSSRTRSPTAPTTRHTQMAGAIHVHPNGRFVYMTNRNSGTEEIGGRKVFKGGENNVAVFSIDPATRRADAHPEHRGADHSSAHLRHRSERPPADRGQHPADGDARRLDAAGGARGLSHRRRRQAHVRAQDTTSTPAASCSSGPASSRCRSAASVIVASAGGAARKHAWLRPLREECHEKNQPMLPPLRSPAPPASPARRTIRTRRSISSAAFPPAAPPTFPRAWSAPRWARSSASSS